MTLIDSIILGGVQGLTEFLPISSSGHLILMRELLHLNTQGGLAFDAILQLATALAVIAFFWKIILTLVVDAMRCITGHSKNVSRKNKQLITALLIGTIPAIVLGLLLEKTMETVFRSAFLIALTLIAGSILFIVAEKWATQRSSSVSPQTGWWIGCFQTLALIPGVSRSGSTISGGLLLGLDRSTSIEFSFLLSLPIILGSGLKKLFDILRHGSIDASMLQLGVGCVTAFVVGFICLHFLIRYLKTHTLMAFVWYRCALALVVLVWLLVR